jgi:hypothetical protein
MVKRKKRDLFNAYAVPQKVAYPSFLLNILPPQYCVFSGTEGYVYQFTIKKLKIKEIYS